MGWLSQSFLAMASSATMILLITDQVKKGMSSQVAMLVISLTWLPCFAFWSWRKGCDGLSYGSLSLLVLAGLLSVLANWAQFEATAKAPNPGLCIAIISSQMLVITLCSHLFFRSELTLWHLAGIVVCLIGVAIISLAK